MKEIEVLCKIVYQKQIITKQELITVLNNLKNKKSAEPDNCKPEFYKTLATQPGCIITIVRCLNKVLITGNIPEEWRTSHTKLIPKCATPTTYSADKLFLQDICGNYKK